MSNLQELSDLNDDWDGYGSKKPKLSAIKRASEFLKDIDKYIEDKGYIELKPHISADSDGNIVVEWHKGDKELLANIADIEIFFILAGSSYINDMKEINYTCREDFKNAWEWLTLKEKINE